MLGLLLLFIGLVASEFDHEIHRKFKTLPRHEFLSSFTSLNYSWTIAEYGTENPRRLRAKLDVNHSLPIITHDVMNLPVQFDAREQWPHCETIKQIYDQGDCESCYLFAAINSASDRTCIHTGVNVHLSEEEGDCIKPRPCDKGGDYPAIVLKFWLENGLVTQECKTYDVESMHNNICKKECKNNSSIDYSKDKHFAEKVYYVESDINTIRAEVVKNGPVVVAFSMFDDFYEYKGGVYEHKYGYYRGDHVVRLIGFGVDDKGVDYWLIANSWGPNWGENGFFRVKRNQTVLGIEEYVYAGLPRKT